jgi:hypothetical protein
MPPKQSDVSESMELPSDSKPGVDSATSQMNMLALTIKDDFILEGESFDASKLTLNRRSPSPRYVDIPLTRAHLTPDYGKNGQVTKVEANMYMTRIAAKDAGTV